MPTAPVSVVAAGLTLVVVAVVNWAPARIDIADPAPSASPEQVVEVYLTAVTARDFATANRLTLGDRFRYSRLDRAPRYLELRVGPAQNLKPGDPTDGQSSADAFAQAARVPVSFHLHGGDTSQTDGPTEFGYLVVRNDDSEPWLIVDSGVV
ncbi:MAG: hypothetical protein IPJ14_17185 [Kineosporiaceae bacterium]|jgi:hypothetical protein|nr:hypothetical protein [Kineosporiaceae bacterium]MBK8075226.1 hypothetical protein [Kineosporiaceae bacterium]